jgi:hypothetical protein
MGAWAETVVKRRDDAYPPCDGEACAGCGATFRYGESAFRLTERKDDEWVCTLCAHEPAHGGVSPQLEEAADEGMGT